VPTIRDVARRAGVSVATVSRVISENGYPVAARTRHRVRAAASALEYSPNLIARGLKKRASGIIGLIFPDITNPFYPAVARGAEDVARQHGYTVVLCNTDEELSRESLYLDLLRRLWIDGFLFATVGQNTRHLRALRAHHIPVVLVARDVERPSLDAVFVDSLRGARLATGHLIALGHRRIAHIAGTPSSSSGRDRRRGYERAMAEARLPVRDGWVIETHFRAEEGYRAAGRLLAARDRPSAVFVANDLMAVEALRAARDAGVRVPEELAIVGFDDIPLARAVVPALTTVAQPAYHMGALAMERLLRRIAGHDTGPTKVMLDAELVIRQSCGAPLAVATPAERG
jgi:LacI family transcriptional regulator